MLKTKVYQPRSIKRARRTRSELEKIDQAIYELLEAENPMTCRQCFYRLVSQGVIDKTEATYKNVVIRRLTVLRRARKIPFDWIADNTRWMRKPSTHGGMESAIRRTAEGYRRAMWDNQDAYVEVWIEKDALAGVVYDITASYDVPLMVCKGFASVSYLYSAAENIAAQDKPAYIYFFGDHDPSGLWIPRKVEEGMREWAPDAEIHFKRVAVTEQQIVDLDLPTRPTKHTDSRAKGFKGDSVDLDAIPPTDLRRLVEECIQIHVDSYQWDQMRKVKAKDLLTIALSKKLIFIHKHAGNRKPLYATKPQELF